MNRTAILLALAAAICTASCKKSDNDESIKPTAVTYPYSYDEQFTDSSTLWTYNNTVTTAKLSVTGGYLHYVYHPPYDSFNTYTINPAFDTKNDFAISTSVHSDNAVGLVFGVNYDTFGYAFEIDNNGRYALFAQGDTKTPRSAILNWTKTPAAQPGFFNKLELDQVSGEWYGYINGVQVFSVTARTLTLPTVGFVVEANTNADADYLNVKWN
jgi:hypothetical protein